MMDYVLRTNALSKRYSDSYAVDKVSINVEKVTFMD